MAGKGTFGPDSQRVPECDCDAGPRRPGIRIVALGGGVGCAPGEVRRDVQCIAVTNPYEAASEILALPTAGLVLDLRSLSHADLGLLAIARQMDTEVLAVGAVPDGLTSEDLSGVRLISRADLPSALDRLAREEYPFAADQPAPTMDPSTAPDSQEQAQPAAAPDEARLSTTAPLSAEELRIDTVTDLLKEAGEPPVIADHQAAEPTAQEARGNVPPTGPASPTGILTAEELSALLEDEQ